MSTTDEIARLQAETARLKQKSEQLRREAYVSAFEMSHVNAEWQHRALEQPRQTSVDPRVIGKFNEEFATIVYRLRYRSGRWPSVGEVLEAFGYDERYTTSAAGQLLSAELEKADTAMFLSAGDDFATDDWHVLIEPAHVDHVHELFTHWEMMEEQLIAGSHRWHQGDPDPFGTVEDLEYRNRSR